MQQKELAQLLGISTGAVSRLVKRGMPTDSLERAQRWRKRHLEPGRIKGSRFNPSAPGVEPAGSADAQAPAALPREASLQLQALTFASEVLSRPGADCAGALAALRRGLQALPDPASVQLPAVAWGHLVAHGMADAALERVGQSPHRLLTIDAFAELVSPGLPLVFMWLDLALDLDGFAVSGYPEAEAAA